MDKLKEKTELLTEKEDRYIALTKKAEKEKLSDAETAEMSTLGTEIDALEKEVADLKAAEERTKKIVARQATKPSRVIPGPTNSDEDDSEFKELKSIAKQFSISRAMVKTKSGKALDGAEEEVRQIAEKEAQEQGFQLDGQISIPSSFIKIGKRKHVSLLDVATEGADVVFTEYGGRVIPYLNPQPVADSLGVTFMQGLNGNVQWPRESGDLSFGFETETSDVNETTPTFDNVSISPKRFGGYVDVSLQIQKQAPFVIDTWIRNKLNLRYEITMDTQIFNGSGSGNQTTGLFNISGVNTLSLGSGSANNMTYPGLLSMKRDCRVANARSGRAGWVTNAYGEFALYQTPLQSSGVEGHFVLNAQTPAGTLLMEPFKVSNIIPADFSEGGQTDLVGIAYSSNWGGLICGLWGGIDLTYDPITQKLGGKDRFIVNAFMDVDVEQALEFSICKDWDASDLPALT